MRMVQEILKFGAAFAVGLPVFLYFFQERMLFHPTPQVSSVPRPARGEVEDVRLVAPDGRELARRGELRCNRWAMPGSQDTSSALPPK